MDQFLAVTSDPVPGREAEYETWYNEAHLPEVLSIPGFAAARRFVATDVDPLTGEGLGARYLTLYQIDGTIEDALDNLARWREEGRLTPLPDAVDKASLRRVPFRAVTDWVTRSTTSVN
jgi:hypothetical protein